ncbi:hypothetical protein Tco_1097955 [Tanacetum coccineum]
MNKAEEEKENYANSKDEEEFKKVTKSKIEKEGHKKPSKQVRYLTWNTRSLPKPLFDAMSGLSYERKRCLKQMHFKRYIQFPIVELPSKLAYNAIENFHSPSMKLRLQKGSIKATRQKVNYILGIPMGNTKFQDLDKRPNNDPFIAEWEAQYNHLGKPTPRVIALQMSGITKADFMFKINFLTLFGSTIGTLENGGRVPKKLVKCIKEEIDISDIDWCGYILNCLHDNFDPDEDQNGIDLYKGLDVYIEPLSERKPVTKEAKIIEKFEKILEERHELVQTLTDRVAKFEKDQTMFDFCKLYKEMFNNAEFNLYESSMDEDSNSDGDQDNDNNKTDYEGAPMEDGNEQSDNENETQSGNEKETENKVDISKGTKEVSMEVDDLNEEIIKEKEGGKEKVSEKDGNETENNENMNKIEMKNDSLQKEQQGETNKEKQAKVDKVEKNQEKQDEYDHLTQDEFWDKHFTDKDYE